MKTKTTDLTGKALDWAVGVAVEHEMQIRQGFVYIAGRKTRYSPATNWAHLGPLITDYIFKIEQTGSHTWIAWIPDPDNGDWLHLNGENLPEAACRAIVAAMIGDQVDVPEVLCQSN